MRYSQQMKARLISSKVVLTALVMTLALMLVLSTSTQAAPRTTITYYHTDALGSIVAASDEQGDVLWEKSYDPYGNEVFTTEDGEEYEGQAYTGKPYDKETGLLYLGQRYYDPQLKRFLSMDPVGFVPSNPTSFNRYAYANNNPYRFIDPDGRYAESPLEAASIAIGLTSLSYNLGKGNYGSALVDVGGLIVDGFGVAIPLAPGVASASIASYRASEAITASSKLGDDLISPTVVQGADSLASKGITRLSDDLAGTFAGGRYTSRVLDKDLILYRAGTADRPLGQFFSRDAPVSAIQTRIDKAVLPVWPGGATSPIDTVFRVRIPAGTTIHTGRVGSQGGHFVGGTQQIVVEKPWLIQGVEVLGSSPLR